MLLGGIEGGGTKFVCAVGDETGTIHDRVVIPTTEPAVTLNRVVDYLKRQEIARSQRLEGIGIATFGPVDLDPSSPHYGCITRTPKTGWAFADVVGPVQRAFPDLAIGFDTDVNGAGLGEHTWGAARGRDTFVYLTVGTGIGGGGMVGGRLMHGLIHPEMGHILLPRHPGDPLERGVCPFHPNCLEGLACGPSVEARWQAPGEDLPADHRAWEIEAFYLAHAAATFLVTFSPQVIILGGSVMHQRQLFPLIRAKTRDLLGGYLVHPRLETLDDVIVPPELGDNAGVMGAIALALAAREGA